MYSVSPLVRKKVGGERGVEGCVPLTGELREETHTPDIPSPQTQAFTQRGLFKLGPKNCRILKAAARKLNHRN